MTDPSFNSEAIIQRIRDAAKNGGQQQQNQQQNQTHAPLGGASAILARLRQRQNPPPEPLRIIDSSVFGRKILGVFPMGKSWLVKFSREANEDEYARMFQWCKDNCTGGQAPTELPAQGWQFFNETDWNLFITTFK